MPKLSPKLRLRYWHLTLDKTLTITADNGKEFAGHETLAEQLEASVYFAHSILPGSEDWTRTPMAW